MSARITMDGQMFMRNREARGISIEDAAEKLGLEPHVLAGIEKGTRTLSPRQAGLLHGRLLRQAEAERVVEAP